MSSLLEEAIVDAKALKEAALKNAGVPYGFHRYEGAGHGFQDSGKPERYSEQKSEDAWAKAIGFLDRYLKG